MKKIKSTKDVKTSHKPMTVYYVPDKIKLEVCQLLHSMVEKYSARQVLKQLYANTLLEGLGNCSMRLTIMSKKELEKVTENVEASHALAYLFKNWKYCVDEGEKIIEELQETQNDKQGWKHDKDKKEPQAQEHV